ncbi:MAG: hypothetical protein ACOVQE_00825, partial [Chitinophagaceae bacterium]
LIPFFTTSFYAIPVSLKNVALPQKAVITWEIEEVHNGKWYFIYDTDKWIMYFGKTDQPVICTVKTNAETAICLLSKTKLAANAKELIVTEGNQSIAAAMLQTISVMA